jgi:type I restriction enzyme S subunit
MGELQLPEGWCPVKIGEIANVIAGGTPKASDPKNFAEPEMGIAWLTPADLSGYNAKYISHGARDLSQHGYDSSSAKLIPKGSILFSSRAPIGYVAIAKNDISTNQGFKNFVFTPDIDPRYSYYYMKNIKTLAESLGTGTTFKEISGATAKTLPFIIAPPVEQKIIADKLDTLLAQVETTKARLERIPVILKRFRQSVLAAAVSGKLTEEWRKDNGHNIENWLTKKLDDISSDVSYGYTASSTADPVGPKMLRITDIQNNKVDWDDVPYCEIEAEKKEKYLLQIGDLLFARTGATVGKSFLIRETPPEAVYASYLIRVKCFAKNSIYYLSLFFQSENYWQQIMDFSAGIGQPNVNGTKLKNLQIPLPQLQEQTEIVRRVEQLFAYADNVEQQVQAALTRVNNLTPSILAKAFRGELTADWRAANPDLISGDNSAEALLEKIKAEREALAKQPKKRKPAVKKKTGTKMSKQILKVIDALKAAGKPLSGQELLTAAGYPSDSDTDQLERFFLDLRDALGAENVIKQNRDATGQDWFALAE